MVSIFIILFLLKYFNKGLNKILKIFQAERDKIESIYPDTHFNIASRRKKGGGVDHGKTIYVEPSNNVYKVGKQLIKEGQVLSFEWQQFINERDAEESRRNKYYNKNKKDDNKNG